MTAGAPPLDWWNLPWDQVYDRLIRAMVPEKVCGVCGEPSRRIVGDVTYEPGEHYTGQGRRKPSHTGNASLNEDGVVAINAPWQIHGSVIRTAPTIGWTDCGHNSWRPGVVLDPFQPGDEMTATFYVGDAIETMNKLPEKSVDLILTSPPFLALRSYLPADHPDKALEGGSQATPGAFIDWLIDVVEACDRVLAPHGSMCIELGDTYAGGGGTWDDIKRPQEAAGTPLGGRIGRGWPLAKSLSLIPELFRLTLVYGTNPLTGRTTERWRLRNVVRWVRPNPPVGALGDKFRPATSELMVFCKSAKRYFDLDAVREPYTAGTLERGSGTRPNGGKATSEGRGGGFATLGPTDYRNADPATAGAPPLDWWNIPPGGFSGSHYAVFPPELCIKPIKAMCPEKVCRVCGEPSRRITEPTGAYAQVLGKGFSDHTRDDLGRSHTARAGVGAQTERGTTRKNALRDELGASLVRTVETTGWSDCGHDDWRPGVVLDPFGGSGTTALVATGHGRDCILIDLDERNFDLSLERVGPFILERGNLI